MTTDLRQPDWFIAGGGAIGLALASRLRLAGNTVALLGREADSDPVEFRYHDLAGEVHDVTVPLIRPGTTHRPQRLLLTTKAYSVNEALRTWGASLASSGFLLYMQNGIVDHEVAGLPEGLRHLVVVNSGFTAYRDRCGDVRQTACSEVLVGEDGHSAPDAGSGLGRDLDRLRSAGLELRWVDDIERRRWMKLAVNAVINPLSVIHDCRNGEIPEAEGADDLIRGMCEESSRALDRLGIEFDAEAIRLEVVRVARHTARNYSSMHQDHRRGAGSNELDYINLPLLRVGERHGLDMSRHRDVHDRVRAMFAAM